MSGHSKWATIKRAKAITDAKKGKIFSKLSKEVIVAARGGGDPTMNFTLRLAVERAKAANMPADNIERAIKKGAGLDKDAAAIVDVTYEAYGPGGVAVLIDCQTDNTNRSLNEVRLAVERSGGKLGSAGNVSWQFEEKGQIIIRPAKYKASSKYGQEGTYENVDVSEVEENLIEIEGIEDIDQISDGETIIEVITDRDQFRSVYQKIQDLGYKIENAELAKIPKEKIELSDEDQQKLTEFLDAVDEVEDVKTVWHNAK
jgi:YebC/PmpR family DNA-binding regulatory protein